MPRSLDVLEDAFQWPPKERAGGLRSFRVLDDGQLEAEPGPAGPVSQPVLPRLAEPRKTLRRKSHGRKPLRSAWTGGRFRDASALAGRATAWLRRQLSGAAVLLIALTAVLEGVYIVRTLSSRPTLQPQASSPEGCRREPRDERCPCCPADRAATAVSGVCGRRRRGPQNSEEEQRWPRLGRRLLPGGPGRIRIEHFARHNAEPPADARARAPHAAPEKRSDRVRPQPSVQIAPGRGTSVKIDLPTGLVHVNALPWAEVWIDGRPVGETPIGNLSLAIGPHELVFRHPTLGEKTLSAVIKAGVLTRLSADMR